MSALNELKSVVLWITEKSNGLTLQGDRRARLAYGCLDLAIEHMAGISVLAEQPFWGPVYALTRPEFDALIRGMWLGLCATEDQLDRFTNDTLFKGKGQISIIDMVTQVEARAGYSKGILTKLRESSWSIMSDFTHTGFKHVWRRNSETHTGPNYPADETEQVLRLAASLGLLAATAMADMSGNKDVAAAGLARAKEFAATSPTRRDDNHTEGTPQETPHGNPLMDDPDQAVSESTEPPPVFANHIVLYLDFLGVSDAAKNWDGSRAQQFIDLLKGVAQLRAPFDIDGESLPDGSYKIKMVAETSTFSDHIVASYPLWVEPPLPWDMVIDIHLKMVQDIVCSIASKALSIGMLVRGGLTMGKLFHDGGVVFGEAMIDAHRLESTVAVFPRVAVSSRLYSLLPPDKRSRLIQDTDGIWHLDYIGGMADHVPTNDRESWLAAGAQTIQQHVIEFERAERWNEYAKWAWLQRRFQQ